MSLSNLSKLNIHVSSFEEGRERKVLRSVCFSWRLVPPITSLSVLLIFWSYFPINPNGEKALRMKLATDVSEWRFLIVFVTFTLNSVELTGNNCERRFLVVSFSFTSGSRAKRFGGVAKIFGNLRSERINVIAWPQTCLSSDSHFQERNFSRLKKAALILFFDLIPRKIHENIKFRRNILAFDGTN